MGAKMNVITEFHQESLWWSMQLLCDRLGWTLYRPYGMDWYTKGYYKLYGHLGMPDPYGWLAYKYLEDTVYDYDAHTHTGVGIEARKGCDLFPKFNLVTLDEALSMKFDYIICGIKDNEPYFRRFRDKHNPDAKLIRHVGNAGDVVDTAMYKNIMSSDKQGFASYGPCNKILYHQEFPLWLYTYEPIEYPEYNNHYIYAFINGFNEQYPAADKWARFTHALREFQFCSFGAGCEDGKIFVRERLVEAMLQATFFWHYKWIDGYGHTLYNAGALGRPVITAPDCYAGKMGEELLTDGETCVMDYGEPGIFDKVRYWSQPDNLLQMCENMHRRFTERVNFNYEFENVLKPFLERC
ncbi:MAG: hypothetical protein WC822_04490 [Candidatus Paceibacterota bacterium]|jgi:hypothetical protein